MVFCFAIGPQLWGGGQLRRKNIFYIVVIREDFWQLYSLYPDSHAVAQDDIKRLTCFQVAPTTSTLQLNQSRQSPLRFHLNFLQLLSSHAHVYLLPFVQFSFL